MEIKTELYRILQNWVRTGECKKFRGRLKVGVDLGTANTVLAVVDSTNRPIAGVSAPSHAIRDGVIVNYYESVQLVTKLKAELEEKLGTELPYLLLCHPSGSFEGSVKSIGYVLAGAGFEVMNIVDEPTACPLLSSRSQTVAVVDVGGGNNRYQHPQRWQSHLHRWWSSWWKSYDRWQLPGIIRFLMKSRSSKDYSWGKRMKSSRSSRLP